MDLQPKDQRKSFQVDFSWGGFAAADLAGVVVLMVPTGSMVQFTLDQIFQKGDNAIFETRNNAVFQIN